PKWPLIAERAKRAESPAPKQCRVVSYRLSGLILQITRRTRHTRTAPASPLLCRLQFVDVLARGSLFSPGWQDHQRQNISRKPGCIFIRKGDVGRAYRKPPRQRLAFGKKIGVGL